MFHLLVVLGLLSLCVKTQAVETQAKSPIGYASDSLQRCTVIDRDVRGDYFGEMDGSGLANLSSANGSEIIRLSEPGALSGITHKYALNSGVSIVRGVLYDHIADLEYDGKVNLISSETAGGDNCATIAADNLTFYEGKEVMLSFIPKCYEDGPGLAYAGPYFISEEVDSTHAITCLYRTMSLGRPYKCFSGISTSTNVEDSLSYQSNIDIRSLSPPTISSWYSEYRMDWYGSYSVRGVGVWQERGDSEADKKGFFVGTLHISEQVQLHKHTDDVIVLEGYVTIPTGGATIPKGVLRLATWESVQQYDVKTIRTGTMLDLGLVSKWTCTTDNRNNYNFKQITCGSRNSWEVFPIGVWSQFVNHGHSPECMRNNDSEKNTLILSDYYQDSTVHITRHIGPSGAVLDFEAYGAIPDKGHYVGPTKLIGCDRAVSHKAPYIWQDIRIVRGDLWMATNNALVGMPDFQSPIAANGTFYRFRVNHELQLSDGKITQVFKSHNRGVQSFLLEPGRLRAVPINDRAYIALDVFGTNLNTPSMLHQHSTNVSREHKIGPDADGIICLLVPEDTCILQHIPVCYTHIGGTEGKVHVQFPIDIFSGIDFTKVGNAFYTGSVYLLWTNSKPAFAPITVHGNIFPIVRNDCTDGKSSASDGMCSRISAFVVTIVSMGFPLEQQARLVCWTSAQEDQAHTQNGRNLYVNVVVSTFNVWFGYRKAASSMEELSNSMRTFTVFSTCTNQKGCLKAYNDGLTDTKRLALLTESLENAKMAFPDLHTWFLAPNKYSDVSCVLFMHPKKNANWVANGLWAVTCNNHAIIYFLPSPCFQRQVSEYLGGEGPSDTEAYIYGLSFFKNDAHANAYPTVVQPKVSVRKADGISISKSAACNVIVNGRPPGHKGKYYMVAPMFTGNHLLDRKELRYLVDLS